MRKHAELLALLLLVVFIVAMVSLAQRDDNDETQNSPGTVMRSSYKTFPEGYLALYLTLEELKFNPQRLIRPLSKLPPRGILLVTDPYVTHVEAKEGKDLVNWVARGNYALINIEQHPAFLEMLGGANATQQIATDSTPNPLAETIPAGEAYQPVKVSSTATTTAQSAMESFLTESAPALQVRSTCRFPKDQLLPAGLRKLLGSDPKPLYTDEHGVVAAYSQIGRGGIVWCCSPWSFSNNGLAEGKNLDFLLALMNRQPGGPVLFDEYHHGYGAGMTIVELAPPIARLGLVQVAVAILLLFVLLAWRFGPHRLPERERFTRSRAEYLTSMAGLLHRAKATPLVRDRLALLLRREIGKRLGLSSQTPLAVIREANARNPVVDQAVFDRVLQQFSALEGQARPDHDALYRLTIDVHRLLHRKSLA